MEFLFILGLFLVPVGVAGLGYYMAPSRRSLTMLGLSLIPLGLALRVVIILFSTDYPSPTTGELVLPVVLLVVAYAYLWIRAYQEDPKLTSDVTAAASYAVLGYAAARKYQETRDQERASALADELERRAPGA